MLIRVPPSSRALESEVTPESVYLSRRKLMQGSLALAAMAAMPGLASAYAAGVYADVEPSKPPGWFQEKLAAARWQAITAEGESITPFRDATHYNNFYEFGTGKGDPAANAGKLQVEPWTVMVDGEVSKPGRYSIEDLVKPHAFEERIYRLRCVEAWAHGHSLAGLSVG